MIQVLFVDACGVDSSLGLLHPRKRTSCDGYWADQRLLGSEALLLGEVALGNTADSALSQSLRMVVSGHVNVF